MKKQITISLALLALFMGTTVGLWTTLPLTRVAYAEESTTTFTGAVSNYWHVLGNWTNGVPNSDTVAVIPQNRTVFIMDWAWAYRIEIEKESVLFVRKGTSVTQKIVEGQDSLIDLGNGAYIICPVFDYNSSIGSFGFVFSQGGGTVETNHFFGAQLDPDEQCKIIPVQS